ncbi:titin-like isoform X4 [Toxorhynchites rutilus septentrionalis]|uniref:titin-like isoform X4 n=1 Tax=Toxorhynchites rutilus septentrionalis TaxID=329112 RepID=UPI002478DC78|nr:titin-like isoform X4 [Toxorhynchites rutilus septentrionalis]
MATTSSRNESSGGFLGPRKTMIIMVTVVGCVAILWPKVFYPMMAGPGQTKSVIKDHRGPGEGIRQERPPHLRPETVHPAMRERGRAIPNAGSVHSERPQSAPRIVEGRPGPIPGMRPPMGAGSHQSTKSANSMGFIMPLYTIGIVSFFIYTILKLIFKKTPTAPYPEIKPDPAFRDEVFTAEPQYIKRPDSGTTKLGEPITHGENDVQATSVPMSNGSASSSPVQAEISVSYVQLAAQPERPATTDSLEAIEETVKPVSVASLKQECTAASAPESTTNELQEQTNDDFVQPTYDPTTEKVVDGIVIKKVVRFEDERQESEVVKQIASQIVTDVIQDAETGAEQATEAVAAEIVEETIKQAEASVTLLQSEKSHEEDCNSKAVERNDEMVSECTPSEFTENKEQDVPTTEATHVDPEESLVKARAVEMEAMDQAKEIELGAELDVSAREEVDPEEAAIKALAAEVEAVGKAEDVKGVAEDLVAEVLEQAEEVANEEVLEEPVATVTTYVSTQKLDDGQIVKRFALDEQVEAVETQSLEEQLIREKEQIEEVEEIDKSAHRTKRSTDLDMKPVIQLDDEIVKTEIVTELNNVEPIVEDVVKKVSFEDVKEITVEKSEKTIEPTVEATKDKPQPFTESSNGITEKQETEIEEADSDPDMDDSFELPSYDPATQKLVDGQVINRFESVVSSEVSTSSSKPIEEHEKSKVCETIEKKELSSATTTDQQTSDTNGSEDVVPYEMKEPVCDAAPAESTPTNDLVVSSANETAVGTNFPGQLTVTECSLIAGDKPEEIVLAEQVVPEVVATTSETVPKTSLDEHATVQSTSESSEVCAEEECSQNNEVELELTGDISMVVEQIGELTSEYGMKENENLPDSKICEKEKVTEKKETPISEIEPVQNIEVSAEIIQESPEAANESDIDVSVSIEPTTNEASEKPEDIHQELSEMVQKAEVCVDVEPKKTGKEEVVDAVSKSTEAPVSDGLTADSVSCETDQKSIKSEQSEIKFLHVEAREPEKELVDSTIEEKRTVEQLSIAPTLVESEESIGTPLLLETKEETEVGQPCIAIDSETEALENQAEDSSEEKLLAAAVEDSKASKESSIEAVDVVSEKEDKPAEETIVEEPVIAVEQNLASQTCPGAESSHETTEDVVEMSGEENLLAAAAKSSRASDESIVVDRSSASKAVEEPATVEDKKEGTIVEQQVIIEETVELPVSVKLEEQNIASESCVAPESSNETTEEALEVSSEEKLLVIAAESSKVSEEPIVEDCSPASKTEYDTSKEPATVEAIMEEESVQKAITEQPIELEETVETQLSIESEEKTYNAPKSNEESAHFVVETSCEEKLLAAAAEASKTSDESIAEDSPSTSETPDKAPTEPAAVTSVEETIVEQPVILEETIGMQLSVKLEEKVVEISDEEKLLAAAAESSKASVEPVEEDCSSTLETVDVVSSQPAAVEATTKKESLDEAVVKQPVVIEETMPVETQSTTEKAEGISGEEELLAAAAESSKAPEECSVEDCSSAPKVLNGESTEPATVETTTKEESHPLSKPEEQSTASHTVQHSEKSVESKIQESSAEEVIVEQPAFKHTTVAETEKLIYIQPSETETKEQSIVTQPRVTSEQEKLEEVSSEETPLAESSKSLGESIVEDCSSASKTLNGEPTAATAAAVTTVESPELIQVKIVHVHEETTVVDEPERSAIEESTCEPIEAHVTAFNVKETREEKSETHDHGKPIDEASTVSEPMITTETVNDCCSNEPVILNGDETNVEMVTISDVSDESRVESTSKVFAGRFSGHGPTIEEINDDNVKAADDGKTSEEFVIKVSLEKADTSDMISEVTDEVIEGAEIEEPSVKMEASVSTLETLDELVEEDVPVQKQEKIVNSSELIDGVKDEQEQSAENKTDVDLPAEADTVAVECHTQEVIPSHQESELLEQSREEQIVETVNVKVHETATDEPKLKDSFSSDEPSVSVVDANKEKQPTSAASSATELEASEQVGTGKEHLSAEKPEHVANATLVERIMTEATAVANEIESICEYIIAEKITQTTVPEASSRESPAAVEAQDQSTSAIVSEPQTLSASAANVVECVVTEEKISATNSTTSTVPARSFHSAEANSSPNQLSTSSDTNQPATLTIQSQAPPSSSPSPAIELNSSQVVQGDDMLNRVAHTSSLNFIAAEKTHATIAHTIVDSESIRSYCTDNSPASSSTSATISISEHHASNSSSSSSSEAAAIGQVPTNETVETNNVAAAEKNVDQNGHAVEPVDGESVIPAKQQHHDEIIDSKEQAEKPSDTEVVPDRLDTSEDRGNLKVIPMEKKAAYEAGRPISRAVTPVRSVTLDSATAESDGAESKCVLLDTNVQQTSKVVVADSDLAVETLDASQKTNEETPFDLNLIVVFESLSNLNQGRSLELNVLLGSEPTTVVHPSATTRVVSPTREVVLSGKMKLSLVKLDESKQEVTDDAVSRVKDYTSSSSSSKKEDVTDGSLGSNEE